MVMVLSRQKIIIKILFVLMILSCYQVYLFRVAGSYIPLSTIAMAMCVPFIKISKLKDPLFSLFLASIILNICSVAWSPVFGLWEYQIVFGYVFIITYAVFKEIDDNGKAFVLIKIFLVSSLLNAFLVILFRFNPDIESVFIQNFLGLFKNPDRLGFDTFLNVSDVDKAGGVFDNANTAASLHLVCIGLTIMIKSTVRKFIFSFLLSVNIIAVICSGSKSALLIMIGSFMFAFSVSFLNPRKNNLAIRWFIFVVFLSLFLLFAYHINDTITSSTFAKNTTATADDRLNLISFATDMFMQSPLIGLGYGGWQIKIGAFGAQYAVRPDWPPHNSIIEAWATAGIFNSIICILVIFILIKRSLRFIKKSNIPGASGPLIAVLGAVAMPLGDPQPFLGAPQLAAPLGIACCYVYRRLKDINN
ncbi:O-antigen ligase family protein [Serratia fonticola]